MGAVLNKTSLFSGDSDLNRKDIQLIPQNELDLQFNKLYSLSREKLHSICDTPREQLLENIGHCWRRQSKSLAACFNEVDICQHGIVDMVTERLTGPSVQYNVPSTGYDAVGEYIKSNNIIRCDSLEQSPPPASPHDDTVCPKAVNDSLEVNADAIQTRISIEFLE